MLFHYQVISGKKPLYIGSIVGRRRRKGFGNYLYYKVTDGDGGYWYHPVNEEVGNIYLVCPD